MQHVHNGEIRELVTRGKQLFSLVATRDTQTHSLMRRIQFNRSKMLKIYHPGKNVSMVADFNLIIILTSQMSESMYTQFNFTPIKIYLLLGLHKHHTA